MRNTTLAAVANFNVIGNVASIRLLDGKAVDEVVGAPNGTKAYVTVISNIGDTKVVNDLEGYIPDKLVIRKGELLVASGLVQKITAKDKKSSRTVLDVTNWVVGMKSKQYKNAAEANADAEPTATEEVAEA